MDNQKAIRLIRNLPTMCEFTDAYREPIDSDAYYEAVDMAISALRARDAPDTNVDTISRRAAIDAIESTDWYHINTGGELVHGANSKDDEPLYKAKDIYSVIENLPSAQPDLTAEDWKLIKQLRSYHNGSYARVLDKLIAVASQPAIIHCRDCKYYYFADNRIPQEQRYICDLDGDRWQPDDFCSYAERREE